MDSESTIYSDIIYSLSELVGKQLLARDWRVATAESCTGGGIAAAITKVAGSSAWFEYGIVSYADEAKKKLLHVKTKDLEKHGAVSKVVVKEMAKGMLAVSGADIVVAVSGIAGPTGGSLEKPVGSVWFAWALADGRISTQYFCFVGQRNEIQQQSIAQGLRGLIELLRQV
jgi:nicotinamide-nucleotide amidase